jgi:hypothetical protein
LADSEKRLGRVIWVGLVWAIVAFVVYSTYLAVLVFVYSDWPTLWGMEFAKALLLSGGAYGLLHLYKFFAR